MLAAEYDPDTSGKFETVVVEEPSMLMHVTQRLRTSGTSPSDFDRRKSSRPCHWSPVRQ
jgi:hypothetical protein